MGNEARMTQALEQGLSRRDQRSALTFGARVGRALQPGFDGPASALDMRGARLGPRADRRRSKNAKCIYLISPARCVQRP